MLQEADVEKHHQADHQLQNWAAASASHLQQLQPDTNRTRHQSATNYIHIKPGFRHPATYPKNMFYWENMTLKPTNKTHPLISVQT